MTNKLNPTLMAKIQEILAEAGVAPEQNGALTVFDLWDQWAPTRNGSARGPNIRSHRRFLAMKCSVAGEEFVLGEMAWADLKPMHMNAWRAALALWVGVRKKLLSASYRDQVRLSLQACFTFHLKTQTISRNPLQGIAHEQNRPVSRRGYFSPEQFEQFVGACKPALAAILRLSITCSGMRRDEMRLLKKSQIDFDAKTATVTNKGGGKKRILLTDESLEMLRGWVATSPSETVFWNPHDPQGGPIPKGTLWRWVDAARRATGIMLGDEKPTIHHTRHTWTRRMMRAGAPETWIASQLGHRDTKMLRVYGPLDGQEAEDSMREIMNRPTRPGDNDPRPPNPWACPGCKTVHANPRALVACMDSHGDADLWEGVEFDMERTPARKAAAAATRAPARKSSTGVQSRGKNRYAAK